MSDNKQFTILGKGYFRDNEIYTALDGKQYQNEFLVIKERVTHEEAQEVVSACTEHGGGWDLPHQRAFLVCVDLDDPKDARHAELKEVLPMSWVWMKKKYASSSGSAWCVCLYLGGAVGIHYRRSSGLAVGCRRVPPSQ
jgi:hypothetical protein